MPAKDSRSAGSVLLEMSFNEVDEGRHEHSEKEAEDKPRDVGKELDRTHLDRHLSKFFACMQRLGDRLETHAKSARQGFCL